MKLEIAKLWVKALRSGEYKQGMGALRNLSNEFCCLGVLCNEHAKAHPEMAANEKSTIVYLGSYSLLPSKVARWAGIRSSNGHYSGDGVWANERDLVRDNDSGRPFKQIADIIEKNVDRL